MLVVVAFDVVDKVLQNDSVVNRKVWGDDEITHCMWVLERKVSNSKFQKVPMPRPCARDEEE